jgi:hypothetical protein
MYRCIAGFGRRNRSRETHLNPSLRDVPRQIPTRLTPRMRRSARRAPMRRARSARTAGRARVGREELGDAEVALFRGGEEVVLRVAVLWRWKGGRGIEERKGGEAEREKGRKGKGRGKGSVPAIVPSDIDEAYSV